MRSHKIFIIEDNPGDIKLTQQALKKTDISYNLVVATDGALAIDIINKQQVDSDDLPDIIILDLNLPKSTGMEVLKVIKNNRYYSAIPIVVFSSSKPNIPELEKYGLGVNNFAIKPMGYKEFCSVIKKITNHWLKDVYVNA